MSAPLVSVVINCLNGADVLEEALSCLRAQTMQDFEIVFWDNASTDASLAIAKAHGPQLRAFQAAATVPLGAARNLAIAQTRGKLVAFLDCDDLWLPHKLEQQAALFAANPRVGLVCTDTEIREGTRTVKRIFAESRPARGMVFAQLVERQWISMSSAMVRREALEGLVSPEEPEAWFDQALNVCEEADVFYRIAHDWELDFVDAPLTVWRVHGGNTTFRKFGQFAAETRHILAKHRRLFPDYDRDFPGLAELLARRADFQQAVALWREGKGAEARRLIAPWRHFSKKFRLFWWASHLPGCLFDAAARLYFALPGWVRK